jgi:hypothetical protein
LGDLLEGAGPTPKHEGVPADKSYDPADLGPGLRVLILQRNGVPAPHLPVPRPSAGSKPALPVRSSLLLADVGLLTLTWLWFAGREGGLTITQALGISLVVSFAAWLACLAAWLHYGSHAE